ncbi:universal stress protein [Rhodocytophaga aerolata]|uniref:Universal stress protein n=1 Tax=Rhodocytophaga aerolata TaxID=455078 RepID=A0ABT8QZY9_9BACT|nr:universal stress protein [Rhodocytophaga aerolata]MDO1445413.1 universal stress protein [Rhodocytophaga aerolata]
MQTILCPIDFSENSTKVLLYAYDIALATGAELFLLHTYHIPRVVPLMEQYQHPEVEAHITYEREAREKLENLMNWLNKIHAPATVKAVYKIGSAFAVDEIVKTTYEQGVDLIVLGTRYIKDLKSIFFGSTIVRVIEETHRPVLVIPAAAPYAKINHLLFTSHQFPQQEMLLIKELAKAFEAQVTLMLMREKSMAASHGAQAISGNDDTSENTQFQHTQVLHTGHDIQRSISSFMEEHPSTLLAISASRRHLLDEVNAGQASYPLYTPVLILR